MMAEKKGRESPRSSTSDLIQFLEDTLEHDGDIDDERYVELYHAYQKRGKMVFKEFVFKEVVLKLREELHEQWD